MRFDRLERGVWLALAEQLADTITPFQRPEWLDYLLQLCPRSSDVSIRVTLDDGAIAAVPIVRMRSRIGHATHWSLPHDHYGSVLCERPLAESESATLYRMLLSEYRPLRLTPPPAATGDQRIHARAGWQIDEHTCHLLQLPQSHDEWLSAIASANCRRDVRRAERAGLRISKEGSPADLDAYHGLYLRSASRWGDAGGPVKSRADFAQVLSCPLSRLYLVYKDSTPAAGMITLETGRWTVYYLGAVDHALSTLCPAELGISEIIRDSIAQDRRVLSFGGSLGKRSLERFKEKFGAAQVSYPTMYSSDVWTRTVRSCRYYVHALKRARAASRPTK